MVWMADGSEKAIKDVVVGDLVLAYDIKTDSLVPTPVVDTFKGWSEDNYVLKAKRTGEDIYATHNHPFLTISGRGNLSKRHAETLTDRVKLVVPSNWEVSNTYKEISPEVGFLLGALLGDGCYTNPNVSPKLTNKSEEIIDKCIAAAKTIGLTPRVVDCGEYLDIYFSNADNRKGQNVLTNMLRQLGMYGLYAHEKTIPSELLYSDVEVVREVVKGLIATDGHVRKGRIDFFTSSKKLAHTFKLACLRLGVYSTTSKRTHDNPNHRDRYVVSISGDSYLKKIEDVPSKPLIFRGNDRAVAKYKSVTTNIEKAEAFDIYCITVAHEDHLFVSNGYVLSNSGKTFATANEVSYHLTGEYPDWWEGKRFKKPISAWAASDTTQSTRDILQVTYMGSLSESEFGTGTIPKDNIGEYTKARSIADALDTVWVKHKSGGWSTLGFKSYDQGRSKFQGTAKDLVHLDEEPPLEIYEECLIRTMTTKGQIILSMTPLSGLTKMVQRFYGGGMGDGKIMDGKALIQASWEDAEHLSEEEKEQFRKTLSPEALEAREKGIPSVGTGMVYPVKESQILVERFPIPDYYKQAYSIDFGWSPDPTVALFGAYDPETDILYLTKEYQRKEATPTAHADSLTRLGAGWMRGVADPYGGSASSQVDGESLIYKYTDAGLKVEPAERDKKLNGITDVLQLMQEGRLKVFDDLEGWLSEFRMYAYDEKGRPKDGNDHFMDAMRYLVKSFHFVAKSKNSIQKDMWGMKKSSGSPRPDWRTV